MTKIPIAFAGCLSLSLVATAAPAKAKPICPNSVVSNDLEFIATSDTSAFACVRFDDRRTAEMPDRRKDGLMAKQTFIFTAHYTDGTSVGLWAHQDFKTRQRALTSVKPVAAAVGKLPTFMRRTLDHVVIHVGDETAFGESDGHFFVLYSENIKTRIRNHDLEETVFHECHATLDKNMRVEKMAGCTKRPTGISSNTPNATRKAKICRIGLFAWTLIMHPGCLPEKVEAKVRKIMPHRIAFFEKLFLAAGILENGLRAKMLNRHQAAAGRYSALALPCHRGLPRCSPMASSSRWMMSASWRMRISCV